MSLFLCMMCGCVLTSLIMTPAFPVPLAEETSSHFIFLPPWSTIGWPIFMCGFISGLCSVPLMWVSLFVPIPHFFDYCSFVVLCELWDSYVFWFPIPRRIPLAILGLLWFHMNFWIIYSSSAKNVMGNLIGIHSTCRLLWVYRHFNSINSSNPRA